MGQRGNIFYSFAECATICNVLQPVHFLKHVLFAAVFYLSQLTPVFSKEPHEICGMAAPWSILLLTFIITRRL
jgi:hypothetical protein